MVGPLNILCHIFLWYCYGLWWVLYLWLNENVSHPLPLRLPLQAYSNLLRAHMDGLKKKDKKSKSKKTKATQWALDSHVTIGYQHWPVRSAGDPWEEPPLWLHATSPSLPRGLRLTTPSFGDRCDIMPFLFCFCMVRSHPWLLGAIDDQEQDTLIQEEEEAAAAQLYAISTAELHQRHLWSQITVDPSPAFYI